MTKWDYLLIIKWIGLPRDMGRHYLSARTAIEISRNGTLES